MKIDFNEVIDRFNENEWSKEKDLCDFIENNITSICESLDINIKDYEREKYIGLKLFPTSYDWHKNKKSNNKNYLNSSRVDFMIKQKDETFVLLEVKNPKNEFNEIRSAISQIMEYIVSAEENNIKVSRSILMTTKIDQRVFSIIERFNIPMEVVVIKKGQLAIWQNYGRKK